MLYVPGIIFTICAALLAVQAHATTVTWTFSAKVSDVPDVSGSLDSFYLDRVVKLGDTVSGHFSFDPDVPENQHRDGFSATLLKDAIHSFEGAVGITNLELSSPRDAFSFVQNGISVSDENIDSITVMIPLTRTPPAYPEWWPVNLQLKLFDVHGRALTRDGVPRYPPANIADFGLRHGYIEFAQLLPSQSIRTVHVQLTDVSFYAVPLPPSIGLCVAGILSIALTTCRRCIS